MKRISTFEGDELERELERRSHEWLLLHAWRAAQLRRLGVPAILAEAFADAVDWHDVAPLIARGCPPWLACHIVR